MRVLVTGDYGCIGSWVARELVERGHDVWIFDLRKDTHRLDLVLDPEQRSKVQFIAGDVSDKYPKTFGNLDLWRITGA